MAELLCREDVFLILELLLAEAPELSLEVYEWIGDVCQEINLDLLPHLPVLIWLYIFHELSVLDIKIWLGKQALNWTIWLIRIY